MHMMCGLMKEEEGQGECSTHHQMDMQAYQQQLMLLQHHQLHDMEQHQPTPSFYNATCEGGGTGDLIFPPPDIPSNPWSLTPPVHDTFLVPPQPVAAGLNLYHRPRGYPPTSSLQFPYEGLPSSSDHIRILSEALCPVIQPGSNPFGLQAELGKMTAQEIMDAKALAASKSHSEAERRRRERINNHLSKLRSLIPNTPKTDKASLLAEVIHHVKELKRQTSLIAESSPVPTEADELTVDAAEEDGKLVIKASLCCEDRPDLLPDLIKALKELRLRTLKAEITTLGGRVKNVLFITGDQEEEEGEEEPQVQCLISAIQEALKAVMEKAPGAGDNQHHDQSSSGIVKRQRTTNSVNIYP